MIDQPEQDVETGPGHLALAIRLIVLSLLFAVPIVFVADAQLAVADRAIRTATVERAGLRFGSTALALLDTVDLDSVTQPPPLAQRRVVADRLRRLDADAEAIGGAQFRETSSGDVRRTWAAYASTPTSGRLASLGSSIRNAVSLADDAAGLSFENHALEADVQDILTTQVPAIVERLAAASATAEGAGGRGPALGRARDCDRRCARDGRRCGKRAPKPTSTTRSGTIPRARWRSSRCIARSTSRRRPSAIGCAATSLVARRDPRSSRSRSHGRTSRREAAALSADLERQLGELLDRRIADNRAMRVRVVVFALLGILASGCGLALIGRAAVARERRALARARQEARALSAELASRRMARALLVTQAQFRAVFDRSPVGLALLDDAGLIVERNDKFDELIGRHVDSVDRESTELRVVRAGGTESWIELDVARLESPESSNVEAIAILRDITERKAVDERLRHAATHDAVTGLPNRVAFIARLGAGLAQRGTAATRRMVLFADLDGFKHVNDTLGHHAGDRLLVAIARRLTSFAGEDGYVARFHGDEFAILVDGALDASDAERIANDVQNAIRAPLSIDGKPVIVTSSVGIVTGVGAYERAEDVVRDADVAMYHAKALGGSSAVFFDEAMDEQRAERHAIDGRPPARHRPARILRRLSADRRHADAGTDRIRSALTVGASDARKDTARDVRPACGTIERDLPTRPIRLARSV